MRILQPSEEQRVSLLKKAVANDIILRLLDSDGPNVPVATAFDIYRATALGDDQAREVALAASAENPETARVFARMAQNNSLAQFTPLRAADTGSVHQRVDGGYSIEVNPSTRQPGRCFLVISTPLGEPHPSLLMAWVDGVWSTINLPIPEDDVIQLVLDEGSLVVLAVGDRKATLILL